ncbi:MAG: methyltransferase [Planctomycetaceae bacterium]|nr:methyltransferase [Planctomycetaceae bacterium]
MAAASRSKRPRSTADYLRPRNGTTNPVPQMKSDADRLLVNQASMISGPRCLVLLDQGTTLAAGLREAAPGIRWAFFTPEEFYFQTLRRFHPEAVIVRDDIDSGSEQSSSDSPDCCLICGMEPPDELFDTVVLPTTATGNGEQTQELIQTAFLRLKPGGLLISSTNNPRDSWLHQHLKTVFGKVTVEKDKRGVVYLCRRSGELKRRRDFCAEAAFRWDDRLVMLTTRPGVFSHRRVDGGARALIRSIRPSASAEQDESSAETTAAVTAEAPQPLPVTVRKVCDLGCGSGAAAMAAALLYPDAHVLAVDSHAAAVWCTQQNAIRNQIANVETLLTADARLPGDGSWDLILTNPPYYSDYRISELFLQSARTALRKGGQLRLVTKLTDWHSTRMNQLFRTVTIQRIGEYDVLTAIR